MVIMNDPQSSLTIEYRAPRDLKPNPRNARTHSPKQIRSIAASIRRFGFVNPVLIDQDGVIIAGHGRVMAAKELGLDQVPVILIEHMSENERRAYIIADNKLAEQAGWDRDILACCWGSASILMTRPCLRCSSRQSRALAISGS
jgi:ParB-like chromosome segregation protein Spo0J